MRFIFLFLFLPCFVGLSQTRPILNQYMNHQNTFNPGYIDPNTKFAVSTLYRRQWMRQKDFPQVGLLYGHYNIDPTHAVGLSISNDLINDINHFDASGNYVYNIALGGDFNLGLGARIGISEQNLIDPNLVYFDPIEPTLDGRSTFTYMSAGIGVSISSETFEAHLSMPYIFGNQTLSKTNVYNIRYNHFYFSTGYKIRFSDWFVMYPSMIATALEGSRVHASANLNFLASQLIWYGFGMSSDYSLNLSVGVFSMGGLRVIYSYDNSYFTKHPNTGITHEVTISYGKTMQYNAFNSRKTKRKKMRPRKWK